MAKKPVKKKTPAKKKAAPKKKGVGDAVAKHVQDIVQNLTIEGATITRTSPHADGNGVDVFFDPAVQNARLGVEAITGQNITGYLEHKDRNGFTGNPFNFQDGVNQANKLLSSVDQAPGVAIDDFTPRERMFIYCYTTNNGNGTQAIIDAGYEVSSREVAASMASENLRKPHIKKEIERIMTEKVMPKEEVLNRFSAMARASLNDYLHVVKKPVRPMVKTSLRVLIAEANAKIEDQQKFIDRLAERKARDTKLVALRDEITMWQEQVIRWEIALERDPFAVEEREGPEQLEEVIELDLVKLARDKEKGLIKTLKPAKGGGWEVELYGADGALTNIGRYHGIFDKDNVRLNLNSEPLTDEEIEKIAKKLDREF